MYRVRFHLQSGKHYKHWQVCHMKGSRRVKETYYDPAYFQLELMGCKLVNKVKVARRVHAEGVKDVAGWVECKELVVIANNMPHDSKIPVDNLEGVFYNPILDPHWRRDSDCGEFVWDDSEYETLVTQGKRVYILEERV